MGRHIVHAHDGNASYVYAHFHGGGAGEHVDVAGPELLCTQFQFNGCKLGGMFLRPEVGPQLQDTVMRSKPETGLPEFLHILVLRKPCACLLNAGFGSGAERTGIKWDGIFFTMGVLPAFAGKIGGKSGKGSVEKAPRKGTEPGFADWYKAQSIGAQEKTVLMRGAEAAGMGNLFPCLAQDAVYNIGMIPLPGVEMERSFKKTHQPVLSVAMTLRPDYLEAAALCSVRRQKRILIVGHAQQFSPVSGKIGSTVASEHEISADFQKVFPILKCQICITQLRGKIGDIIQSGIAYGHEPQCFKIDGFCRASSEFTENEHSGKIGHVGAGGNQHGSFFLIKPKQSLKAGAFVLEFFGHIPEGDGSSFPQFFVFFLFAVYQILYREAGIFGKCLQRCNFLFQRSAFFIVATLAVSQTDMIEKSAYACEFGKKLHTHGRTCCSLSAVIEGKQLAPPAGMLHGVLPIWSKLQKYRGNGVLQIGRAEEVVIIEVQFASCAGLAVWADKTTCILIWLFQRNGDGIAAALVHKLAGVLVEKEIS